MTIPRGTMVTLPPGATLVDPSAIHLPAFPRVTDFAGLWSIEASAAAGLQARARATDWAAHLAANSEPRPRAAMQLLSAGSGKNIAVVRLDGTLMKAASSFGGTSTVQARQDLRKAVSDPDILAILIAIDSPGGTVAGTDDLAAEVKAATKSKPVFAFVSDLCASAAYWVASQCDGIYANSDTAWIGSIGTFMALYDSSAAAAEQGVEAVVFRTGPLKGAGAMDGDALTGEQRTNFQLLTEASQKTFDAAVQKGRALTDNQLAAVRTGGVFTASDAIDRKLIDGVQSLEATVAGLIKESRSRSSGRSAAESATTRGNSMPKTLAATAPDDVVELVSADPIAVQRKATADEYRRCADIQRVAAKHPNIVAEAIEHGWSVDRAENAAMKASLPKITAADPGAGSGGSLDAETIVASMCLSLGMRQSFVAEQFAPGDRERVMNQATAGPMRGFSLHALMDDVILRAGMHHRGSRTSDSFIKTAFRAEQQLQLRADGGFSTMGLSGILSNVANKALLNAYTAVATVWQKICAIRNHNDFKTVTRYRLDSTGALKKVAQDGEIKHVGLDNASYTNKLDTYAGMVALTRQMMINDDLGAFAELPALLGRMSSLRVEEGVFALILANTGSFFAGGNNNLLTGATSVLDIAGVGLGLAEGLFDNMVDSNGKPVLTPPSVLLVGTALRYISNALYTSGGLVTGANANLQSENTFRGKYPPVVSPYLNNTALRDQDGLAFSGQTTTQWYLFADPAVRAAIGVAFLNGQTQPTIESSETDFNTLGMQWRAYLDFGVGFEDPTAAVKSAGA